MKTYDPFATVEAVEEQFNGALHRNFRAFHTTDTNDTFHLYAALLNHKNVNSVNTKALSCFSALLFIVPWPVLA